MVVGLPAYLNEDLRQWFAARRSEDHDWARSIRGSPMRFRARLASWDAANPAPFASVGDPDDHIDHIRSVAGIAAIGIGGDYDGMEWPCGDGGCLGAIPLSSLSSKRADTRRPRWSLSALAI